MHEFLAEKWARIVACEAVTGKSSPEGKYVGKKELPCGGPSKNVFWD